MKHYYPFAEQINKLRKNLDSMTKQMESWRSEASHIYKVNEDWVDEHRELLDYLLNNNCDNLDESLHCLYQEYIKLRRQK